MLKKIQRTLQTLSFLTPRQFAYRLKYELTPVRFLTFKKKGQHQPRPIRCLPIPGSKKIIQKTDSGYQVTLLNVSKTYENQLDWNDYTYGQLWNLHLQYADFLKQDDLTVSERENLLLDLFEWLISGKLKPEPYPSSLRIMNLVRFLSENEASLKKKNELLHTLSSELHFLESRPEYHVLGNHLLENAFALLMGGTYLRENRWTALAQEIFSEQVPEQILSDGGHFERSPMYHLIMLYRFLEALYYLPGDSDLHPLFLDTSKKMLAFTDQMTFQNGDTAHFNDSTDDQTYSRKQILQMAEECGISDYPSSPLSESGYRRFENDDLELIVDACGIKPDSQPGHAHADSLSFILYVQGDPVIVDPGVSTYEANARRDWERSTQAHNTVTYLGQNTADVWGKFRVAGRPEVEILSETDSECTIRLNKTLASGDDFEHHRQFTCSSTMIDVSDTVHMAEPVEGRLHFHPAIKIKELSKNTVILKDGIKIEFQNIFQLQKFTYEYSKAFNLRTKAVGVRYTFKKSASLRMILPGR